MLEQKCLSELKNNCKKENVSFSRIRAVYVGDGEIISELNSSFLTLPDEEQFKYAAVARQVFSGKPDEKMLELAAGHTVLENVYDYGIDNDAAVNALFEDIKSNYAAVGRYLIILLEDNYDVLKVNSAGETLDESEETYRYIMCIICPVKLSDSGIECSETGVTLRKRDWVMSKPDIAMVYPAFKHRSADEDSIMYYAGNPKETHKELMTQVLDTDVKYTIAQHQDILENIVSMNLLHENDLKTTDTIIDGIHFKLEAYIGQQGVDSISKMLTQDVLKEILVSLGVKEVEANKTASEFARRMDEDRAVLFFDARRASKYKAYLAHQRSRDLLERSKNSLSEMGQQDLADEIETYMERTR